MYNALTQSNYSTVRKILQADMQLSSRCDDCWASHILSAAWHASDFCAHTLQIETMTWTHNTSPTYKLCIAYHDDVQDEQHALFHCIHPHTVSFRRTYVSLFHPAVLILTMCLLFWARTTISSISFFSSNLPMVICSIRGRLSLSTATPDLCSARLMLRWPGGWLSQLEYDPVVNSAIAVFEQWLCMDWLQTVTVYTKLTTGWPAMRLRNLWLSFTENPHTHTLSLSLQPKD